MKRTTPTKNSNSSNHSTPQTSDRKGTKTATAVDLKKKDLLTLKKEVIEQIKSEMDLNKGLSHIPLTQQQIDK